MVPLVWWMYSLGVDLAGLGVESLPEKRSSALKAPLRYVSVELQEKPDGNWGVALSLFPGYSIPHSENSPSEGRAAL